MRIIPLRIKSQNQARELLKALGVTHEGVKILSPKSLSLAFKIEGISSWEANIIKQHLLSLGSDSAISRDALVRRIKTDTLIFGNTAQLRKLCDKLKNQPFNLKRIAKNLSDSLDNMFKDNFSFKARRKTLKIKQPLICGIINVTVDSFSGDGLLSTSGKSKVKDAVLAKAAKMIKEGAKIIDVGAESTRPFSKPIKQSQEIKRIALAVKALRKEFKKVLISVDTYKYSVAKRALDAGADIINDITALRGSLKMAELIVKYKAGCILMHMKGKPSNMQKNPHYKDVTGEIIDFFAERISFCEKKGIKKEQIMIDPGIGFGKRLEDNLKIIESLYQFKMFGMPIFLGLSRKSFIGQALGLSVDERLNATVAANMFALSRGADILRVHDVRENLEVTKLFSKLIKK